MCIMSDESEKVLSYMEMMNFGQSLKLSLKLCEQLKATEIAKKVTKFISDKDNRELFASVP